MRTEADIRALLQECLMRAQQANRTLALHAEGNAAYQAAAAEHLVWVNDAQVLRWVLDELETFVPVRINYPDEGFIEPSATNA
jgi:hypothetical protein